MGLSQLLTPTSSSRGRLFWFQEGRGISTLKVSLTPLPPLSPQSILSPPPPLPSSHLLPHHPSPPHLLPDTSHHHHHQWRPLVYLCALLVMVERAALRSCSATKAARTALVVATRAAVDRCGLGNGQAPQSAALLRGRSSPGCAVVG